MFFFSYQCRNSNKVIEIRLLSDAEHCKNVEVPRVFNLKETLTKTTRNTILVVKFQLINLVEEICLSSTKNEIKLELKNIQIREIYGIQFKDNKTSSAIRLNFQNNQAIFNNREHFRKIVIQYQVIVTGNELRRLLKTLIQPTKMETYAFYSIIL